MDLLTSRIIYGFISIFLGLDMDLFILFHVRKFLLLKDTILKLWWTLKWFKLLKLAQSYPMGFHLKVF